LMIYDCRLLIDRLYIYCASWREKLDSDELKSRIKASEAHELASIFITTRKTAQKNKSSIINRKSTIISSGAPDEQP
jgi:hypothetical protein